MRDALARRAPQHAAARCWWQSRWFALAAILVSTAPLLLPAFPPLVDMPGHIGRYHVAIDMARSADLQRHWRFHWQLIGNLGVDLLVIPLTPLVGVVLAAKLVVLSIPALFVGGLIWLSYECDGRLSPAAPLAFPLAYGFPLQFGFVNFMLSAALALLALAWWIRLGRQRRLVPRALCFVPISWGLWIAHSFGWGMFGLFAFATELVRLRRDGAPWLGAVIRAGALCTLLATPLFAMGGANGGAGLGIEYNWLAKLFWLLTLFRERWQYYDMISGVALIAMIVVALRRRDTFGFDPMLGALALTAFAAFIALPRLLLGGAYVDARMLGVAVALALLAIRVKPVAARQERTIALLATAFFLMRTTTSVVALLGFAQGQARALDVVAAIPRGAAVLVIVNEPCGMTWASDRLEHVDGIAIARRDIFDNGQWALAGQQLIEPRHPHAGPYRADPSQLAYPPICERYTTRLADAVHDFDRGTFGYVWTMDFPPGAARAPDLRLIWRNERSSLYRVMR
ncbi:hypothetical protein EAH79_09695 [Sphingomonas koreensis]|nr:hypothetical protein EAH79_09695 [Sphingomonas koreensis]